MKYAKTIIISSLMGIFALSAFTQIASAVSLEEQNQKTKQRYKNAMQQYQKEVNFYKSARQNFLDAHNKYQKFKNVENKKALEDMAKNYLEKAVSSLAKRLESIKIWISNRRSISEEDRDKIIAEINKDTNWLNERALKIESATPQQIKEEAEEIRNYWKNHRASVKRITGKIQAARINYIIAKGENISERISQKINELKDAGKDTAQLELWLEDYNEKINLTKKKYEAAKNKFQAITNLINADSLFKEGNKFIHEANQYIRQAYELLNKIVKEMKSISTK